MSTSTKLFIGALSLSSTVSIQMARCRLYVGILASKTPIKRSVQIMIFAALLTANIPALGAQTPRWVTARDTQFKFRFTHPPDWRPVTPRGLNVRLSVNGPPESFVNCNAVVRVAPELGRYSQRELDADLSTPFTGDDWRDIFTDKFPDVIILRSRATKVDNRPAQFAVARYSYGTPATTVIGQTANLITLSPGQFWNIGCGAMGKTEVDVDIKYRLWEPTFLRILSSVVFEN